ncbi:MAG TPA: DNA topoisomerase IB [Urbifossiella sp.]|jgi:DNA topoisomerase-1|nr:DNA topoisomerase IB [Urbifossiella sp.]
MVAAARPTARLSHACDGNPGIRRVRTATGFRYVSDRGERVTDPDVLARIRALAIPPAWEKVWVCPKANGHIQATGRDAKGRKQYRYHAAWHARRGEEKFARVGGFGRVLPRVRARVTADLARPGLPRDKVLAAVVRLLDRTHLRVGNDEYRRANGSFGLSTLLDRHASFAGGELRLRFRGKSGVWHDRAVSDPRLARIVRACRDLPGQHLFQYADATGAPRPVGSADVNGYIRRAAGGEYTAKDFRTWAGTVETAALLTGLPAPASRAAGERAVAGVVKEVAAVLGNTPAVCRKSYVHPRVIAAYLDGTLPAGRRGDEGRVLELLGG